MNSDSTIDVVASLETMIYLIICYIRILLVKFIRCYAFKILSVKRLKPEEILNNPMSENELLRLQENKYKDSFDKLVERFERKENEIQNLIEKMNELNANNSDLLCEFNTSDMESLRKYRRLRLVKIQFKLEMVSDNFYFRLIKREY